jgi:hypothetical protein
VTIDQLVNVLADKILTNQTGSDHHIQEVMNIFPTLQFGMDINPKFAAGPNGYEYTQHLDAFDLLHIELVHGWLIAPHEPECALIGKKTYNELVNVVIEGNDASTTLHNDPKIENSNVLLTKANEGSIIHQYLENSSHQLTQYGLTVLHEYMKDGQMAVFFRNNHFNSLTKYDGQLYLLVTDIGYASVGNIVWEKLDVIDGDTEYVGQEFKPPPAMTNNLVSNTATGEQLLANKLQSQADYQLALQLSQETAPALASVTTLHNQKNNIQDEQGDDSSIPVISPHVRSNAPAVAVGVPAAPISDEDRDRMVAIQLQQQEKKKELIRRSAQEQDAASYNLALSLQQEEQRLQTQQQQQRRLQQQQQKQNATEGSGKASTDSNCIIS